jgi:hypothetical protein
VLPTVAAESFVEELAAVVGMQFADRHRPAAPDVMERRLHSMIAEARHGLAVDPAGRHVDDEERGEIAPPRAGATVEHEIGLHRSWPHTVPVAERADRDRLLERRGSAPMHIGNRSHTSPLARQQTVDGRGADRHELAADPDRQRQLLVSLQGVDELGKERDQTLRSQPPTSLPESRQRDAHLGPVAWRTTAAAPWQALDATKDSDQRLAMISGHPLSLLEQPALLRARGHAIRRPQRSGVLVHTARGHNASWLG